MVQRLEGHARRHAAVADERDGDVVAPLVLGGSRHAQGRGDRGARVARAEMIVGRFGATQEFRDASRPADGLETLSTAGEQLVRVTLVTNVEHQAVAWRIEDVVERRDEFRGAEARSQVAASARDHVEDLRAQFLDHRRHLFARQRAQILGPVDAIQQPLAHSLLRSA